MTVTIRAISLSRVLVRPGRNVKFSSKFEGEFADGLRPPTYLVEVDTRLEYKQYSQTMWATNTELVFSPS